MKRELTAEEKLRKKQWHQAYYLANREHILAKQKEYYHRKGKAWNAERVRNYRRANHEAYLTKRKEYRDSHKEYFAELNRRYWQRKKERELQASPEEQLALKRARQEKQRAYYEKHRVELCKKRIGEECFRTMERLQRICPERIAACLEAFPFDAFAQRQLKRQLRWFSIYPSQARYGDCYDAGMLAYLYSIHRCAYMEYANVEGYIRKMIRIYLICAMVSVRDAENLCRENNFREVRLEQLPYAKI